MDFIIIVYSMLYRSTSLFLINVHTLYHLIISDWKKKKSLYIHVYIYVCVYIYIYLYM